MSRLPQRALFDLRVCNLNSSVCLITVTSIYIITVGSIYIFYYSYKFTDERLGQCVVPNDNTVVLSTLTRTSSPDFTAYLVFRPNVTDDVNPGELCFGSIVWDL